jgi:spore maturation protein CgeB
MLKILCIGPEWRGSNANGLFKALSRIGHAISVVDEFYYIPLRTKAILTKVVSRIGRNFFISDFNKAILNEALIFKPDLVLVYKGAFVLPETVKALKNIGKRVVNFYPDVSFKTHGNLLEKTLPLYDMVFTTKTFGIEDMQKQLGQKNVIFIPHGFDPEVHKPFPIVDSQLMSTFGCDASFIGTWSPHKENTLSTLKEILPSIRLKIWGRQWSNCTSKNLKSAIQKQEVLGDLYAIAINCSKVNLGILSEKVYGASSGDKITSRTFHIPAAKGCMLHQNSEEIGHYFEIGKEILVFNSSEDLAEKLELLLNNESLRQQLANAGYQRALKDHSLDQRAKEILKYCMDGKL